ncbi:NPCBM/NEW2 domain-containing protein [Saccharothrix hoggarensis]|uniref:NPCBM/NEW2 domain-containing protein n=1 Tax=Saccharothrix hoggarensis TaxID=913853 RepID=A0ABW3QZC2_9PSEU
MDDRDREPARAGGRGRTVALLSAAGVAVLALGVVIGTRLDTSSTSAAADSPPTSATPPTTPATVVTSESIAMLRPGATWLADLAPVDSSSIDDMYVESPWTAAAARVRGVTYGKAVSATGAWCSSAQLVFALDGKYDKFSAHVGIAEDSLETKGLDFYVLADDKRVAEIPDVGLTPQPVDISVAGASRLAIGVEPTASDLSDCPGPERVGVWADPSLTAATPPN